MLEARGPLAEAFARQILETTRPYLPKAAQELHVLDVGCGYGHTALELARRCQQVTGIEPSRPLAEIADQLGKESGLQNVTFRHAGIDSLEDAEVYDLVVLDNVFEHLPDQKNAIKRIARTNWHGGVLYILVPNKLWPMEVHYGHIPQRYLPLPLANVCCGSRRGWNYTDASYAPTYFRLNRLAAAATTLDFTTRSPPTFPLTMDGGSLTYRVGAAVFARAPCYGSFPKLSSLSRSSDNPVSVSE
ncbi:MAG: class I SAM-dependent methyltransferase [Planctomycetota bacterium]